MQSSIVSIVVLAGLLAVSGGCATKKGPTGARPFDFRTDTLSYANELDWEYAFDAQGKWSGTKSEPPPEYALRCFVVAKVARQFFANARFDPSLSTADPETYRRLIRRVVGSPARKTVAADQRIVIPGYADLHTFSEAQEATLKLESGGAWRSYFQRGNWRMVMPFSHDGQASVARYMSASLERDWPPVVHVVTFPSLSLNHAVVIFDEATTDDEIRFSAYDPNDPQQPITISFDRALKEFSFPRTPYFPGGPVHVYEVYRNLAF